MHLIFAAHLQTYHFSVPSFLGSAGLEAVIERVYLFEQRQGQRSVVWLL